MIFEDGFVVINNYVIEGVDEILVEFFFGEELFVIVIGKDLNIDIVVFKVESDMLLLFVSFGDSDVVCVGDWVMVVGNFLG